MSNHWIDFQHSDVFMAIGANIAENHPVALKWIETARARKGARLITVDPRVSRTAAVSDIHVCIRPGTNIAYLGGLVNYIFEHDCTHQVYLANYTNAAVLVNPAFSFDAATGLFAGARDDAGRQCLQYDTTTWQYQTDATGEPRQDPTLQDPQCVLQITRRHYRDYTIERVSRITGADPATLRASYALFSSTGQPQQAGNILYAMGITQSTTGSQNTRLIGLIQLLLGNMGIAGGGVNALRGQSNVQGASDMAMLYHLIPGYMALPQQAQHPTLAAWLAHQTPARNALTNRPRYLVSLLKAFYGTHATSENEFGYAWLPKLDGRDRSHIPAFREMGAGNIEGLICWADNPAVSGPSAAAGRDALKHLKWLVSVNLFDNETASFWQAEDVRAADIDTEVFLLPAAASFEREGSRTNSGRWIQWGWKCQEPPGRAKADLWIVNALFKRLQARYRRDGGTVPEPITCMQWDYDDATGEIDIARVCAEINGYRTGDGTPLHNPKELAADGSTTCGNWLYSGYHVHREAPATQRRIREATGIGTHAEWAFAWPRNCRILYNRAGCDLEGRPWNSQTPVIWWEPQRQRWGGHDVADIPESWSFRQATRNPFIMLPEGLGRLYSVGMLSLRDGPLPTHYEPAESPVSNLLYPRATFNPVSQRFYAHHLATGSTERQRYPYILTTWRVGEHYQSGNVTRNLPWLNELMPELFIELSPELAAHLKIEAGRRVIVESRRLLHHGHQAGIEARACVTPRIQPLQINGQTLHFVGMPWHWGFKGLNTGAITNDLTPSIGCPNTTIPEYKACLCNIRRA